MVAIRELEEDAKSYASEAIRMDSKGAHGLAIHKGLKRFLIHRLGRG